MPFQNQCHSQSLTKSNTTLFGFVNDQKFSPPNLMVIASLSNKGFIGAHYFE